jgi:glyceraldehyde-3-phosphate dehydrogenase (ferredoxin)
MLGFDAISVGGVLAWLIECVDENLLSMEDVGIKTKPVFNHKNFNLIDDSNTNAQVGVELLDSIVNKKGLMNFAEGARKLARHLSRNKNKDIINKFVFNSFARKGWMVPNQYWTPGVLSPMPIAGKYFMYYGNDFITPYDLGKKNADSMKNEFISDNMGFCRFHRKWAEEMIPEIIGSLWNIKDEYILRNKMTSSRLSSRNSSVFWESERNVDFVHSFINRQRLVEKTDNPEFNKWFDAFSADKNKASIEFWYEMHKGSDMSLREF